MNRKERGLMNRKSACLIVLHCLCVFIFTACATVPLTGRSQLLIIPDTTMLSMSFQQYDQFLKSNKMSGQSEKVHMVKRVGENIQRGVESYFSSKGMSHLLKNYKWEFNLVESEEVNAWCMPGGKVVVYTGILPVAQGEEGLAVVMGHEIAHAIAKHGGERMSQGLMVQMGGVALSQAMKEKPQTTQALWMTAYGVGSQVGLMLPYSRLHETEADHLGLIFMSLAGYDPHAAVGFWERMAVVGGGKKPPQFLSTHPADTTRIRQIKKLLPEAMTYYKGTK